MLLCFFEYIEIAKVIICLSRISIHQVNESPSYFIFCILNFPTSSDYWKILDFIFSNIYGTDFIYCYWVSLLEKSRNLKKYFLVCRVIMPTLKASIMSSVFSVKHLLLNRLHIIRGLLSFLVITFCFHLFVEFF